MKAILPPLPALYGRTEEQQGARGLSLEHTALLFIGAIIIVWVLSLGLGFAFGVTTLTLVAFGATVLGLRFPHLGLIGIGMMATLDPITRVFMATGGLWRWNTFNYWLLLTIALSIPLLLRFRDVHTRLIQLFILMLALGLLLTPAFESGIQHTLGIIGIFGLLMYFARAGHDAKVWYWMAMVNGTMAAIGGLSFFIQKDSTRYVDHNVWAYFPLTAIYTICMAMPFTSEKPRQQLSLVLLALVNVGWLFLNGSRSNLLLGLVAILFLFVAMRSVLNRTIVLALALVMVMMVPIFFSDLQEGTLERFDKLFNTTTTAEDRTNGRATLLLGGWYIFQDNPLGVGTGGFPVAWSQLDMREGLGFRHGQEFSSHSAWMRILVENGIPGFLLLALFVWSYAFVGLRQRDRVLMMLGVMTSVAMSMTFFVTEFQNKGLWFLAAGMIMIYNREQISTMVREVDQRLPVRSIIRSIPTNGTPEPPARDGAAGQRASASTER
jgi:hypothetical protein